MSDKCIDERKKLENKHESTNYDNGIVIIVSSNGKSLNDFNKTTLEKIKNAAFVLIDGDMVLKNSYGPNGRIINTDKICKGSPYLGTGCMECSKCIDIIKKEFMKPKPKLDEDQVRDMINLVMDDVLTNCIDKEIEHDEIKKLLRDKLYNEFEFSVIKDEYTLIPITVAMIKYTCGYNKFMQLTGITIEDNKLDKIMRIPKNDAITLGIINGK